MSKKSCEAAESAESAVLRMARVNCKQHERTLEKMHILLYDDVGVKTINKFNPIPYSTLKNSYFVVYRRGLGNI